MTNTSGQAQPVNPYLVLVAAILLPGFGHVLCGETRRGFTLQMFMVALGIVTWHLATPDTSFVGKLAGGLFIYAISIVDAYTIARRRWADFTSVKPVLAEGGGFPGVCVGKVRGETKREITSAGEESG